MATENKTKLKMLLERYKPGTVCLASWLEKQGISRDLQQYYCKSGWLKSVGRGAFIRPEDKVDWRGGLYAIQEQANLPVHVGGITALSMQGAAQYIRIGREKIYLFSPLGVALPAWFKNHDWEVDIEHVRTGFLPKDMGIGEMMRSGLSSNSGFVANKCSDSERAILECLYLAPDKLGLVEIYQVMEGLVNLRPKSIQQLLESCTSVKVKRLFLYMAEKAGHQWLQFVDQSKIDLGRGDRSIVSNGVYVASHHISIPKELASL
jgi:hypothetical protein